MVTKDEALKMAIEDAMKFVNTLNGYEDANQSKPFKTEADKYLSYASVVIKSLATSLKEALAQPAQEHIGYYYPDERMACLLFKKGLEIPRDALPLYGSPAPSWQGLSDDEIDKIWFNHPKQSIGGVDWLVRFARAIEQGLKEKNHG